MQKDLRAVLSTLGLLVAVLSTGSFVYHNKVYAEDLDAELAMQQEHVSATVAELHTKRLTSIATNDAESFRLALLAAEKESAQKAAEAQAIADATDAKSRAQAVLVAQQAETTRKQAAAQALAKQQADAARLAEQKRIAAQVAAQQAVQKPATQPAPVVKKTRRSRAS